MQILADIYFLFFPPVHLTDEQAEPIAQREGKGDEYRQLRQQGYTPCITLKMLDVLRFRDIGV